MAPKAKTKGKAKAKAKPTPKKKTPEKPTPENTTSEKSQKGQLTESENANSEVPQPRRRPRDPEKKTDNGNRVTKTSTKVTKNTKKTRAAKPSTTRANKKKEEAVEKVVEEVEELQQEEQAKKDESKALIPYSTLPAEREPRKPFKLDGPPITEHSKAPEDWSANNYDIDEFDIDANIKRNIERIKEGVLPQFFEAKLLYYEKLKRERDVLASGKKDLNWNSVIRIDTLWRIAFNLSLNGDPRDQLVNVRALIESYSTKKIEWNGLVTYWCGGNLHKGPEKFDTKTMTKYWKELGRPKSWWVEGWQGPGPTSLNFSINLNPINKESFRHMVDIAVRPSDLPDNTKNRIDGAWLELNCLDDTGAEHMLVYESDITAIENHSNFVFQDMGQGYLSGVGGAIPVRAVLAEVCVMTQPGYKWKVSTWTDIVMLVREGNGPLPGTPRLNGIWMRHMVEAHTMPDDRGILELHPAQYQAKPPPIVRFHGVPPQPCGHLHGYVPYEMRQPGGMGFPTDAITDALTDQLGFEEEWEDYPPPPAGGPGGSGGPGGGPGGNRGDEDDGDDGNGGNGDGGSGYRPRIGSMPGEFPGEDPTAGLPSVNQSRRRDRSRARRDGGSEPGPIPGSWPEAGRAETTSAGESNQDINRRQRVNRAFGYPSEYPGPLPTPYVPGYEPTFSMFTRGRQPMATELEVYREYMARNQGVAFQVGGGFVQQVFNWVASFL